MKKKSSIAAGLALIMAVIGVLVHKVAFARTFYNDAVRETLLMRRRRFARLFRLAGSAPLPASFDIDDTATAGNRHRSHRQSA